MPSNPLRRRSRSRTHVRIVALAMVVAATWVRFTPTAGGSPAVKPPAGRPAIGALESTVKMRAGRVSDDAAASADAMLRANARRIDMAADDGAPVARRLAIEFGTSAAALDAERRELSLSWGHFAIARTLAANAQPTVTTSALAALHARYPWSEVASGLGFDLGQTVNAVRTEARVASGLTPADGRVSRIHSESPWAAAIDADSFTSTNER